MTQNNKIFRYFFSLLICITASHTIYAQDPTYSQYQGNEINFNPAYAGITGDVRFAGTYRTLWPHVPGKPFPGPLSSYNATADMMFKINGVQKIGAGLAFGQDIEGQGYLTTTTYALPISYHIIINKNGGLYFGVRPSLNQIKLDWSRLVFSDQLNPQYGVVQNASFNQGEVNSHYYFNFDAGAVGRFSNTRGRFENYGEVGFAVSNLVRPAISITGGTAAETRLPIRYIVSGRAAFKTVEQLFIGPLALFEMQGKFFSFKAGVDFYYKPKSNQNNYVPLIFGLYHRTGFSGGRDTRSFIAYIGHRGVINGHFPQGRTATYNIGFSADLNYGGLNMQTFGAYELVVGFTIPTRLSLDYYEQNCFW